MDGSAGIPCSRDEVFCDGAGGHRMQGELRSQALAWAPQRRGRRPWEGAGLRCAARGRPELE